MELLTKKKEYEKKVIAGLVFTKKIHKIATILRSGDFSQKDFRVIYEIFTQEFRKGDENWYGKAKQTLEERDIKLIKYAKEDITDYIHEDEMVVYATLLREINKKIKLAYLLEKSLSNIQKESMSDFSASFSKDFIKITSDEDNDKSDIKEIFRKFDNTRQEYSEKIENGKSIIGLESGFSKLDNLIDGIRKGHIWICGGYQGTGKTFFSLNITASLIKQKKKVVFYSLEMSDVELIGRLLGIMTDMNSMKIMKGILDIKQNQDVEEARKEIEESKFTIHAEENNLDKIKMSMITESMKGEVGLFVIDYVQLLDSGKNTEYENMKEAVLSLQPLIKKLGIPILILSQVSNEAAKNPNSRIMGFKGAGDIGAVADIGMEMVVDTDFYEDYSDYRNSLNQGVPVFLKLLIKKNRHGIAGALDIKFIGKTGKFEENE